MARRANAGRTLKAILDAPTHEAALKKLTKALGDTWESGNLVGYREGVREANTGVASTPRANPYREHDGCDCTELCSMGPTCPGGSLAGLPGSGCWRTEEGSA